MENEEGNPVWMEVASQIGDNVVRCIALEATEGLACGMKVENTGEPIKVPVGDQILGRVVNVMGKAIDGKEDIKTDEYWPIYRPAPDFS